jgi:hypothetical protein
MTSTLTQSRKQLILLMADISCLPYANSVAIVANLAVVSGGQVRGVEEVVAKLYSSDSLLRPAMPFTMVANLLLICSSILALSNLMVADCSRSMSCALMMHRYWLPMITGDAGMKNHQAHGRFISTAS